MHHSNPYNSWTQPSANPPTRMPIPTPAPPPDWITFLIVPRHASILNSSITSRGQAYYAVTTGLAEPGHECTQITNVRGSVVGRIDWTSSPLVEVKNAVSQKIIGSWLRLSDDMRYDLHRTMVVRKKRYFWAPYQNEIHMYEELSSTSYPLVRIVRRERIDIFINPALIQLGLVDTVIVVALILQSGRNID